jgi:signal peptidase II
VPENQGKILNPASCPMIFIVLLIILFLDQLTKFIVAKNLALNQSLPVIKGIFHISLIHNRGAAFGILKSQGPIFILTAIFAIILIYLDLKKNKHKKIYSISLSLILAGAIGNLIDRLVFGYVIDFLDFRIWPVFNVADSAITVGAVLLGWLVFNSNIKNHRAK